MGTKHTGYKPGDPAPEGYLNRHAWAEAQHKAGLKQKKCSRCRCWKYPQELSAKRDFFVAKDRRGRHHVLAGPVCTQCLVTAALVKKKAAKRRRRISA